MNYELTKEKFKTGIEIKEIENLIEAYRFAQKNQLSEKKLIALSPSVFRNTLNQK
jgi:hypothetical protein